MIKIGLFGRDTGHVAPWRTLDDPRPLRGGVAVASCTPALSLWARLAKRWYPELRVHLFHANSMDALACLERDEVHAAGVHLYDKSSGACNTPFVRDALPGRSVALINLGTWDEGFITAAGNPKRIRGAADIARTDVAIVKRETGAGSRKLLDDLLQESGIGAADICGYRTIRRSHFDAAREVHDGNADARVGIASVVEAYMSRLAQT